MKFAVVLLIALAVPAHSAGVKIDAMKHSIQATTASKFDTVIGKFRNDAVNVMWFHKHSDEDQAFLEPYNKVATALKGMVRVASMDCTEEAAFCKKYDVTSTPHVVVFPPNPMPHYKWGGEATEAGHKKLINHLMKQIPSFVTDIPNKAEVEKFLTGDVAKPKVLLFSDKDKVPVIFKALSSEVVLHRTTVFGFVNKAADDVVKKFKVKKFPTLLMQRRGTGGKLENEIYKGEMNFSDMQEWVNLYSESGMGDKMSGAAGGDEPQEDAKPWKAQDVPEVTGPSHKDICFKSGEGLCVMYLKQGGPLADSEEAMLKELSEKHTSQMSGRGTIFKWMWMDVSIEKDWAKMFKMEAYPGVVVFNPHKRLRFTKPEIDAGVTKQDIDNLIDKILGGDARFKMVPAQKLPPFATRKAEGKQEL